MGVWGEVGELKIGVWFAVLFCGPTPTFPSSPNFPFPDAQTGALDHWGIFQPRGGECVLVEFIVERRFVPYFCAPGEEGLWCTGRQRRIAQFSRG